jgi:hypothetical protein
MLKVYDRSGREVITLVNENLQPGIYKSTFYTKGLASGIYTYQLQADGFAEAKKTHASPLTCSIDPDFFS